MMDVTVVLVGGGMPSTAVAPVEIFATAGVLWNTLHGQPEEPRFAVRTASLDGRPERTGVPLTLEPTCAVEDVGDTELVIVSGASADVESACAQHARLSPWLRRWHRRGVPIAGVCSGAVLLAEAGLLNGRPATTHWGLVETCRQRYPEVQWLPERMITGSDDLYCSGGVYAAVDLSLYLVERFCGHRVAMRTAKALLLETPRAWQSGYATEAPAAGHDDQRIRKAQEWLFQNFREDVRIEDLAARVGMSPRNLARRFKSATGDTPIAYLQRLRVNAARHLLENELWSVTEVARAVGCEDVGFFRRLFRRHTGSSPREYRERFAISPPENVAVAGRRPHR